MTIPIDIIDYDNNIIGEDTIENAHKFGKLHRVSDTIVYNPDANTILVRKRDEDISRGLFELGIG